MPERFNLGDLLESVESRVHEASLPVVSVSEPRGIVLQESLFKKRIATPDISKYWVVSPGDVVYNPYLLWNGAVGVWFGSATACTSPAYEVLRVRNPGTERFIHYLMRSSRVTRAVNAIASGSVTRRRTAPIDRILALEFDLPPLAEQRRIAGVLGALDDLIEVNRGLIADLNEMAAAQASRWIRSSHLKVRLSEVADHLAGKYLAKDKYAAGGQYVVHGSNSIMGTHSEFLHRGPLTVLARIGSFCGALAFSEDSAWINNNASAIRAKRSSEAYWLHRSLLSVDMDMHRAGSGQPFVRVESLMNTEIPWLSPEELESANRGLGTLEKAIAALQMENSQLASTRDELLPLLMSGRVRVSEDVAA